MKQSKVNNNLPNLESINNVSDILKFYYSSGKKGHNDYMKHFREHEDLKSFCRETVRILMSNNQSDDERIILYKRYLIKCNLNSISVYSNSSERLIIISEIDLRFHILITGRRGFKETGFRVDLILYFAILIALQNDTPLQKDFKILKFTFSDLFKCFNALPSRIFNENFKMELSVVGHHYAIFRPFSDNWERYKKYLMVDKEFNYFKQVYCSSRTGTIWNSVSDFASFQLKWVDNYLEEYKKKEGRLIQSRLTARLELMEYAKIDYGKLIVRSCLAFLTNEIDKDKFEFGEYYIYKVDG